MIRERDPFGRVLGVLRERLRSGAYPQGAPLTIIELARELDLSPTPVREALSRLAGQGLVEDRRGRGYFTWRLDATDLTELYGLSALHLGAALGGLQGGARRLAPRVPAREALEAALAQYEHEAALASFSEALFAWVARAGGGRALSACQAALADRLGPVRRVEPLVLDRIEDELVGLAELFDADRWAAFGTALEAFHDRRRQGAGALAEALRQLDITGRNI